MSPPLRPVTASSRIAEQPEPRLAGPGVEALRTAASRLAITRPATQAVGSPPLRFAGEMRQPNELPHLAVAEGDRLIISSEAFAASGKPRRSRARLVGLTALLLLAAFGAYTLYNWIAGAFLH